MKYLNKIHAIIGKETVENFRCDYWGGNDEGHVEEVEFDFYDGKKDEDLPEGSQDSIFEMCEDIVVGSYGSFAGDFETDGTIYYEAPCEKYPNGRLYNVGTDRVQQASQLDLEEE